ncbi:phosphate transport system regulatory protein PhoU [Cerasicoccus arenae]|uniref:Phosphate-specific transport system accessory protein PhoU n=2 Tax=Cerasicoccus arenae TaxID=424488 RepID=A0A8J3D9D2_9BACT|nr:phosphate transport system regulatory protein PhoU [Cerasicoccus arenae]
MGEKCIDIVRLSIQALEENDLGTAQRVLGMDDEIDELELQIDGECVRYLSLRAPVATDVRLLTLCMKGCHDLERVGDEASSIAKRIRRLSRQGRAIGNLAGIPEMTEMVITQLRNALDSFIDESYEKAMSLPESDRKVDDLNRANFDVLMSRSTDDPTYVAIGIELIFISKSLERIGDHAVNVGEEVAYLIKAKDVRHTAAVRRSPETY